ncbi:MAG: HYR domain-containing protein [Myxococcaceae bacterium]|nr:HYR domain-containing protein [Myxococcaceae bacterium]
MKTNLSWISLTASVLLSAGAGCSSQPDHGSEPVPGGTASQPLSASEPYLVKEINPFGAGATPSSTALVNGTIFFAISTDGRQELWKSDGTQAGTVRVLDGRQSVGLLSIGTLWSAGGALFFQNSYGVPLWKSDGTQSGTINLFPTWPGPLSFSAAVELNGKLYLLASNGLWESDGTVAGTRQVKEVANTSGQLVQANGTLFFTTFTSVQGSQLWKSDGTAAGTVLLPLGPSFEAGSILYGLKAANGQIFFQSQESNSSRQKVWRSDGTEAGTFPVHEFSGFIRHLQVVNGRSFFILSNNEAPFTTNLWTSDGTVAGTRSLTEVSGASSELIASAEGVIFSLARSPSARELWRSDGTVEGTVLVTPLCADTGATVITGLGTVGGWTFFTDGCEGTGREPWRTDGTAAGTMLLRDISPGPRSSSPASAVGKDGALYFWAEDELHGPELWRSDATTAGTVLLKDVVTAQAGADPYSFMPLGESLLFYAHDGSQGSALWKSDGTEAGTARLKPLYVSSPGSPTPFSYLEGTLFFVPESRSLWRSDGTEAGTVLVRTLEPGQSYRLISALAPLGKTLLLATLTATGPELWKSDGTEAGTLLVKQIPVEGYSSISSLVELNGQSFFITGNYSPRVELWKSDGTEAGTTRVRTIWDDPEFVGSAGQLVRVNGKLLFVADVEGGSKRIWRSDGTEAGTLPAPEFASFPDLPETLMEAEGMLYVLTHGSRKLWRSDGASPLTLVKELFPQEAGLSWGGTRAAMVRGQLHFTAFSPTQGWVLWKTDGTAQGTVPVQRLALGSLDYSVASSYATFAQAGKRLFFVNDGGQGRELWALPFAPFYCPADVNAEATGPEGGLVRLPEPQRAEDVDPALPIQSSHPSELMLPFGRTEITLTAVDPSYPASTCTYSVDVQDRTPPQMECSPTLTVPATSEDGAVVDYEEITATDAVSTPTLEYSRAPGSVFPVGRTMVEIKARDAAGNTSTCRFTVKVVGGPGCGCGAASPSALLWWLLALVPVAARRLRAR